jgi:hypothetical protein
MADRALLLERGSISIDGSVAEAISTYLSKGRRETRYINPFDEAHSSPHIGSVELLTSENTGVQHFGDPLDVRFLIRHPQPMRRGYLSFQIINQFQQPVIHAIDPDLSFGSRSGCSILMCHFPNLRLNVGRFYLRAFLSEAPGGDLYETLDAICHFEVVRADRNIVWGWRPEACAYHEQYTWTATNATSKVEL